MNYTMLEEKPSHFVIHDGKSAFKVAKKGLSAKMHEKIRGYACGGCVQHMDEGGDVPPDVTSPDSPNYIPTTSDQIPVAPAPSISDAIASGNLNQIGNAINQPVASVGPGNGPERLNSGTGQMEAQDSEGNWVPVPAAPVAPAEAPGATTTPDTTSNMVQVPQIAAPAPAVPPTAAQVAPATPAVGKVPTGGTPSAGSDYGLESGLAAQQKAAVAEGEAKANQAAAVAAEEKSRLTAMQDLAAKQEAIRQQRQDRGDQLFKAVMNQTVNPDHYWESKGTSGRIMGAIAIGLGAIGSSLTHTPNAALGIIQNAIDRDVDAQKFNINKSQNLVRMYYDQTRDIMAAQQLAKADLNDITAARVKSAGDQFGSDVAKSAANAVAANLRVNGAQLRQDVRMKNVQMAQAGLSMQATRQQMAITAATAPLQIIQLGQQVKQGEIALGQAQYWDMQRRGIGAPQQGNVWAGTSAQVAPNGVAVGKNIVPPMSMAEHNERLVDFGNGRQAYAKTKTDAEKLNEALPAMNSLDSIINRMAALGRTFPGTDAYKEQQDLKLQAAGVLDHLKNGRVNDVTLGAYQKALGGNWWYGPAAYNGVRTALDATKRFEIQARTGIDVGQPSSPPHALNVK